MVARAYQNNFSRKSHIENYSLELEDFSFIPGAKHLILHVETEPIDDFEGFMVDKENESLGRYAGQIGKVKASQYAYADGETKSGIKINRDKSLMIFLKTLCNNIGISEWFVAQDNLHDTIEDLIIAFNKTAPFKDIYIDFCIAGKEYVGKTGYTNYDMYLPKADKGKYSFGTAGKVTVYDEKIHLKKTEVKEVKKTKTGCRRSGVQQWAGCTWVSVLWTWLYFLYCGV